MDRRELLRLSLLTTSAIFVPQFGAWYKKGKGLLVESGIKGSIQYWELVSGDLVQAPVTFYLSANGLYKTELLIDCAVSVDKVTAGCDHYPIEPLTMVSGNSLEVTYTPDHPDWLRMNPRDKPWGIETPRRALYKID